MFNICCIKKCYQKWEKAATTMMQRERRKNLYLWPFVTKLSFCNVRPTWRKKNRERERQKKKWWLATKTLDRMRKTHWEMRQRQKQQQQQKNSISMFYVQCSVFMLQTLISFQLKPTLNNEVFIVAFLFGAHTNSPRFSHFSAISQWSDSL